ncbi:hypothetical protein, partial [Lacticaseibacillus rhamnosus]|uniref:hypothetical protein n=1 Tax=Lacticaseibacillus rhamnosus TaxID=47715 RepID=UPI001F4D240D
NSLDHYQEFVIIVALDLKIEVPLKMQPRQTKPKISLLNCGEKLPGFINSIAHHPSSGICFICSSTLKTLGLMKICSLKPTKTQKSVQPITRWPTFLIASWPLSIYL